MKITRRRFAAGSLAAAGASTLARPALADTSRELAQIAVDQALLANVNPQQIAAAQQLIQQGDTGVASGDFASAILSFQRAWQRASQR